MDRQYVWTAQLERAVLLRPGTSDAQVWDDVFLSGYHLPPAFTEMDPRVVLDLGANIGLTTAHYGAIWPEARVVAIEMDKDNAVVARLNAPTSEVICCAVAATIEAGSYDPDVSEQTYVFIPGGTTGQQVKAMTLAEIGEQLTEIDFVKMDIEGTEWDILAKPTWAPFVNSLLVELHDRDGARWPCPWLIEPAVGLLEDAGYHVSIHDTHPCAVWATR